MDAFRREYNEERPHEALAMRTPSACYTPSPRAYPARHLQATLPRGVAERCHKTCRNTSRSK